jgi:enoyl-CoA hydratase
MGEALEQIRKDENIRVLIFRGTGDQSFIAGADVNDLKTFSPLGMFHCMNSLGQKLYNDIKNFPIPTIALARLSGFGG